MMEENNGFPDENLNRKIDERVKHLLKGGLFTQRKITDTPTDNLSVTNKKYVNLFGPTSSRPISSVAHLAQKYFDTTIGRPIYFNPNSSVWTDGAGSVS